MRRERARALVAVEGQSELEEHVLKPHDARARPAATGRWTPPCGRRVEVPVDHPVEERDGGADDLAQPLEVKRTVAVDAGCARLIEPRLQTAVSSSELTSMISVQRLERWTTRCGGRPAWLQVRLAASLKVIQPLPVSARVRIIRAYSWRAGTWRS